MSFNSVEFVLFLPIFLLIFYSVKNRENVRDIALLIASYLFYMSWYWHYAGLIALSTFVDYHIGRRLDKTSKASSRKLLLLTSVVVNLGILALFKYYNFFIDSISAMMSMIGIPVEILHLDLLLPVGISFYTFQSLSYTIDLYFRKIPVENSFIKFATFVSFFPQLVAGPIVRASVFLPQLREKIAVSQQNVTDGLRLVFIGLFKKIVIADLLAYLIVDEVFENTAAFSTLDLIVGLYAYAFQIYCDFSGYSDIAIGVAIMMGFKLPINFNKPYLACSPSDFWRRWHITLSEWLRDYLYIPLGGNRVGRFRMIFNLLLTMLLGGLWHGAAWNFVLWGGYHGVLLACTRNLDQFISKGGFGRKAIFGVLTFHAILFSWLLFRVADLQSLNLYFVGLSQFTMETRISSLGYLVLLLAALTHFLPGDSFQRIESIIPEKLRILILPVVYAVLLLLFVGASVGAPAFIYFQF